MTDPEIKQWTEALRQAHLVVVGYAERGGRASAAYQDALARLSLAVARSSELITAAPEGAGRSRGRVAERPPRGVSVEAWREFVYRFELARSVWFGETGAGVVNVSSAGGVIQPAGGSSMSIDAGYITRQSARISEPKHLVESIRDDRDPRLLAALAALRLAAENQAKYQVDQYARAIGANEGTIASRPPPAVMTENWAAFLALINSAMVTLRTRTPPVVRAQVSRPTAPATATPSAPAAAAPPAQQQQRQQQQRRRGEIVPAAEQPPATEQPPSTEPPGIIEGWQNAFRALFTGEGAGGMTAPVLDRLQAAVQSVNPLNTPIYRRPWFAPVVIIGASYIGYDQYKKYSARAKKTAKAEKKPAPAAAKE